MSGIAPLPYRDMAIAFFMWQSEVGIAVVLRDQYTDAGREIQRRGDLPSTGVPNLVLS